MSDLLSAFQRRHQEKLDQLERGEDEEALLDGVHILVSDLRQAGATVVDPAERGQLRALVRFWANVVYGRTGRRRSSGARGLQLSGCSSAGRRPSSSRPAWRPLGGCPPARRKVPRRHPPLRRRPLCGMPSWM